MKDRIDDVEVLRALAVLIAVVEHLQLNLFTWRTAATDTFFGYWGGWAGVDLFFTISGFVIARDLIPRLQSSASPAEYFNKASVFWLRRFWRIIPSAWFWLVFIMLSVFFLNQSGAWGEIKDNYETVLSAFLQVANLHIAHVYGQGFSGAAFPYWSLSLEEQFYLLLPFMILFSGRWLPHVLGAIVIVQLLMVRDSLYPNLLRTDALFLGVLISIWSRKETFKLFDPVFMKNNKFLRYLVLTILVVAISTAGAHGLKVIEHRLSLIAIISSLLVFIAAHNKNYISDLGFLKKPLLWVGTRSYAMYLIHLPAYFMTREFWYRIEPQGTVFNEAYMVKYLLTAVPLLLILCELNYRFIETPLRERGVEISARLAKRVPKKEA